MVISLILEMVLTLLFQNSSLGTILDQTIVAFSSHGWAQTAGDVFTLTYYDIMGRVEKSSNPYRNVELEQDPCATEGLHWTTPEYDELSRTKKVTSADATIVQITHALSLTAPVGIKKTITDLIRIPVGTPLSRFP